MLHIFHINLSVHVLFSRQDTLKASRTLGVLGVNYVHVTKYTLRISARFSSRNAFAFTISGDYGLFFG